MFGVGTQELLVILLIALIVVGPQKLPELARQIGKGMRELRKVQDEVRDMVKIDLNPEPPTVHQPGVSGPKKRSTLHRSVRPASPVTPDEPTAAATPTEATPAPADEPTPAEPVPITDEPPADERDEPGTAAAPSAG